MFSRYDKVTVLHLYAETQQSREVTSISEVKVNQCCKQDPFDGIAFYSLFISGYFTRFPTEQTV